MDRTTWNEKKGPQYLGIDGGGTRCRATLVDVDMAILGKGVAGPANTYQDIDQAVRSIVEATELALADARLSTDSLSQIVAGAGLAGVNLPAVQRATMAWDHPFRRFYVTTDLEIACLGAHAGNDGAVMITGTGSSGCSVVDGDCTILGAFGYPFADKCSGAWFGLQAIRSSLQAEERLGPDTIMQSMLSERLQGDGNEIIEKLASPKTRDLAEYANLVFDAASQNDSVAIEIIKDGVEYLERLAARLWETRPPTMSLLGGLRGAIQPWLGDEVASALTEPQMTAEEGACLFVQREHLKERSTAGRIES